MIISGSILYDLAALFVALGAGLVGFYKWWFSYWERRGVEIIQPSIPFGNLGPMMKKEKNFGELYMDFYKEFKSRGLRFGGTYSFARPFLVVVDVDLVKNILTKDFAYFFDRGMYINEKSDPLLGNLFLLEGDRWKNLRSKLSPAFTAGKMKMMFQTLVNCSYEMKIIVDKAESDKKSVDVKEIIARFTTDVIVSCAFGVECNTLKNPDSQFRKYGKRFVENSALEALNFLISFIVPSNWLKLINFKLTKTDVEQFIMSIVTETVEYREKNNIKRNDFLQLLIQLKNRGNISDDLDMSNIASKKNDVTMTISELAAHVLVFFIGGFETSSTTSTFALFQLAKNQEVQDKVREEIHAVLSRHGGECTYEALMEMKYMEQVINETLRMFPPVSNLTRICTKDYPIPDSSVVIEKGTMVIIPVTGIQRDADYYPDPDKFNPDRFSEHNKGKIPPGAWVPFGEGPRICIGIRMGIIQTKIALITVIKDHRVIIDTLKTSLNPEMDATAFITTVKGGVWLNLTNA